MTGSESAFNHSYTFSCETLYYHHHYKENWSLEKPITFPESQARKQQSQASHHGLYDSTLLSPSVKMEEKICLMDFWSVTESWVQRLSWLLSHASPNAIITCKGLQGLKPRSSDSSCVKTPWFRDIEKQWSQIACTAIRDVRSPKSHIEKGPAQAL